METTIAGQAISCAPAGSGIGEEEFVELVRAHQKRIYRLILVLLADREAAGTLTQECFLRAFEKRAKFRRQARPETWLARIAINLARDYLKNRRRAFWQRLMRGRGQSSDDAVMLAVKTNHISPENALLAREELRRVWSVVDRLPQRQRIVFLLRFVEELSLGEIARVTELRVGSVKSHLSRALCAVRHRLREETYARTPEK